jgi:YVTN family beta-propeller protein
VLVNFVFRLGRIPALVLIVSGLAALVSARGPADESGPTWLKDGSKRAQYAVPEDDQYKSPIHLLLSKDGSRLFVACENSNEVLVVDTGQGKVTGSVKVGAYPFGLALSPDESRLYVSNRRDRTVSVVDLARMDAAQTIPVGGDPHGLVTDATGASLYVANLSTDDVSVIDTRSFKEVKRLESGRTPFEEALAPDGKYLYVSNQLSLPVPFRTPPVVELTVIDTERQVVVGRRNLFSTVIGQHVAVSPDNRFVVVAVEFPKNLIPETQVYQGWMVTHGFAIAETGPKGRVAYFLLDEQNLYFADAYGVVFSPDGRRLYVSSSGVDVVSVVDTGRLYRLLDAQNGRIGIPDEAIATYGRDLGISSEYVVARIPTQHNPKDLAISPDGSRLYIANRLSDTIQVVDTANNQTAGYISLGGPEKVTELRRGERLFNYSSISFQKQLSCNTCHPEYHLDGLQYDIVAPEEGIGRTLLDNRTMRGIAATAPYKWTGKNPSIARQDGPRAAQLFFRSHGFEADDLRAAVKFIESIPVPPNRYLAADGRLNQFQRRGKANFERAYTKDGRYIPVANRCVTCHPSPYYTDQQLHDIGSQTGIDDTGEFDTPQIGDVQQNAPFLHDGRCYTLEEIWTVYNPYDTHGTTNDMAKENLNDLIEYVKTLSVGSPLPYKDLFNSLFAKSKGSPFRLPIGDLSSTSKPAARYVGNEVCGTCHVREYKEWLGTKHARSWVMLGRVDKAGKVAASFKMTVQPQNSAICLQCHGTAANVPAEYRADTFHVEDGVQCERCHGPGEKYATEEAMMDKNKAISLGLIIPTKDVCMNCHLSKPSHEFMNIKPFDFESAYSRIQHTHGANNPNAYGIQH